MARHPNAEAFAASVAAFGRGDIEALRTRFFSPDIVWHLTGSSPLAGTYKGIDEALGLFGRFMELSGGTMRVDPHDFTGSDDHAVLLARTTAERPGKRLDVQEVVVTHIRDGRETEVWHTQLDQDAWDDFWS